ncbi:calcium uniporter protein 3, mitochondrial-like [Aristolochia californica]|uniref:calcium uniporter protein 3, mitochondrial-like n=1 Tax=Aristolochia californica TaxID=171875 RepID=UPI0035D97B3E
MAFRRSLARRFLNLAQPQRSAAVPTNPLRKMVAPAGSDERGFLRRLLQRRNLFQSATPADRLGLPVGEKLMERLRVINGERLRLEGLAPPMPASRPEEDAVFKISVNDAKKLLRASQMQTVKERLRGMSRSCISNSEFLEICGDCFDGMKSNEEIVSIARMLDESGAVIALGNVVFLHPEQVVRAVESVIPLSLSPQNDPRREELEKMEKEKEEIDRRAKALVQRELWAGLCMFAAQTVGFMRLTFWELSWDVMEPICFFVTSLYFVGGYSFFLRTSREPSFEGFFESRFNAKQRKLMRARNFDVGRFDELRRALRPTELSGSKTGPLNLSELAASSLHH